MRISKGEFIDHLTELYRATLQAMRTGYDTDDMSGVIKIMNELPDDPEDNVQDLNEMKSVLVVTKALKDDFSRDKFPEANEARIRLLERFDKKTAVYKAYLARK